MIVVNSMFNCLHIIITPSYKVCGVTGQIGVSVHVPVVQVELTQDQGHVKEDSRVKDQDMTPNNVYFKIVQVKLE